MGSFCSCLRSLATFVVVVAGLFFSLPTVWAPNQVAEVKAGVFQPAKRLHEAAHDPERNGYFHLSEQLGEGITELTLPEHLELVKKLSEFEIVVKPQDHPLDYRADSFNSLAIRVLDALRDYEHTLREKEQYEELAELLKLRLVLTTKLFPGSSLRELAWRGSAYPAGPNSSAWLSRANISELEWLEISQLVLELRISDEQILKALELQFTDPFPAWRRSRSGTTTPIDLLESLLFKREARICDNILGEILLAESSEAYREVLEQHQRLSLQGVLLGRDGVCYYTCNDGLRSLHSIEAAELERYALHTATLVHAYRTAHGQWPSSLDLLEYRRYPAPDCEFEFTYSETDPGAYELRVKSETLDVGDSTRNSVIFKFEGVRT